MTSEQAAAVLRRRQAFLFVWKVIFALLLINVVAFMIGGAVIGGVPDKVENGHYFLARRREIFEVSQAVYQYGQLHMIIALAHFGITFVLGFVATAVSQLPPPLTTNEPGT